MKKILTLISFLALTLIANAQTIYICHDGSYTETSITNGLEINPAEVDSITFSKPDFPAPVVNINFAASRATVDIPKYASYITSTITGADVVINNTQIDGKEPTYVVSGVTTNGSLTINGQYKMTIILDGVNIHSKNTPAIDIQCGKRTDLIIKEYSSNMLEDSSTNTGKAALYCKGHMEIKGTGLLLVNGNANHAIATKEYMEVKDDCQITVDRSANDAIHVGQYYKQTSGTVWLKQDVKSDGIQVDATTDATDEYNGQMFISGGRINITVSNEDCKGIKADSDITISGGDIYITANGNGSRGIQTAGNIIISDEDNKTYIKVYANGGKCTLAECADDPHKCTGIKADGNITVNAGNIEVGNDGKKAKGIKAGGIYTLNGGKVSCASIEDSTGTK